MRRPGRVTVLIGLVVAAGSLAAGCGVPERTNVVVDGGVRGDGSLPGASSGDGLPPGPQDGANTAADFVDRFLQAPAGDFEGAADRVRKFIAPAERAAWQAPRQITVVRLLSSPTIRLPAAGVSQVQLTVQQLGVLTNKGIVEPPTVQTTEYTFTVGQSTVNSGGEGLNPRGGAQGTLAVMNAPPVMLLTNTALHTWYDRRPIYFWDTDRAKLVPDLRYMPKAYQDSARLNLLLGWLIGGPVEWLRPAVLELPEGTQQRGNAYTDDGRLVVNLSAAAAEQDLGQLFAQLRWSWREDYTGPVVLRIEDGTRREDDSLVDYLDRNPAYRLAQQGAQLFCVVGGVVHRVRLNGMDTAAAGVPVITSTVNKDIRYAAISAEHAALARTETDGKLRLWVGPDKQGRFVGTSLRRQSMSRPVLAAGEDTGYVAADGQLYRFAVDGSALTTLTISGLSGQVTALAVAPDGARLALVAGGRLYVVALGGAGENATVGQARLVPTVLTSLSGVDWLGQTSLVMSGKNGDRVALAKVTVDGAVPVDPVQDLATFAVTQLAAYPQGPIDQGGGRIMIEADDRAYEVFSGTPDEVTTQELVDPPGGSAATPSAPFFLR